MKKAQFRTFLIPLAAILGIIAIAQETVADPTFTLARGQNAKVCKAYMARLNQTRFRDAPFCDRPETSSVPGFATLKRVALAPGAAFQIFPSIASLLKPAVEVSGWTLDAAKNELGKSILAWEYEPNVDIENNGSTRTLMIWRGDRETYGIQNSDFACGNWDRRTPQLAFVLDASQTRVDASTTKRIFWRTPPAMYGKSNENSAELPIGRHMGVFEFEGRYYFDTFYDSGGWGDYRNQRRNDPSLKNVLAVFIHRDGKTEEVCELLQHL
jgi:hypothetical protein